MYAHQTVLQSEAIQYLNIYPQGIYVDCTLGGAGHSEAIVSQLNSAGMLIAIDQDENALDHASKKLEKWTERIHFRHGNFRHISSILEDCGITQVDGILYDLGVSSPQLDETDRGFSYQHDALLDMRMNQQSNFSAHDVVNTWSENELADTIHTYGEERFAKSIARQIVNHRQDNPIQTTNELVEVIKKSIPAKFRRSGGHPAKRTFQAIRIAVNNELDAFRVSLQEGLPLLRSGGRLCVITFHSLEDRICKTFIQEQSRGCICPPDFPKCVCGQHPHLRKITRKPIVPSSAEVQLNRRSRSAKLRVAEKI